MTLQQRYAMQIGELVIANLNLLQQVEDLTKERDELKAKDKEDDA